MAECGTSLSQMRASDQQPPSDGTQGPVLATMRGSIAAKKCDCRKNNGLDADCHCSPSKRSVKQRTTVTSVTSNERRVEATPPPPQRGRRFISGQPTPPPVQQRKEKVHMPVTLNGDYGIEVRPLPSAQTNRRFDAYNQEPTHHWMERPATPPIPYDQRSYHPLHRLAFPRSVPVMASRATADTGPMKAHGDPISDVVQTQEATSLYSLDASSSLESSVEASPATDPRETREVMDAAKPKATREEVPHHRRPAPQDDREDYHHGSTVTSVPGPMYKANRGYDYEQQMYNYNYRPTMQKQYHADKERTSLVEEPRRQHEQEREQASRPREEQIRHQEYEREREQASRLREEQIRLQEHETERANNTNHVRDSQAGRGIVREEPPQEYRKRLEKEQSCESQEHHYCYETPPAQAHHEGYTRQEMEHLQMRYEHEQRAQAQAQAQAQAHTHAQQHDAASMSPSHEQTYQQQVPAGHGIVPPRGDNVSPCTHSFHYGI